jgi:hypothetical protein
MENIAQLAKTVFVLGAGFTRSFYADAPLVQDTYDIGRIRKRIAGLALPNRILDAELAMFADGATIDIERLLTRSFAPMPHDEADQAVHELGILRNAVLAEFQDKLANAKSRFAAASEMWPVATYCRRNAILCITFNYDDFFDQALWESYEEGHEAKSPWGPTKGYGFPCHHPLESTPYDPPPWGDISMTLLKLHGSVNWRVSRGTSRPYPISDIMHDSRWFPEIRGHSERDEQILRWIAESAPLIVPPVLAKSDLLSEPLLRLLWVQAYDSLRKAERVVFIGYAFSPTDIAARFLFSEAMHAAQACEIVVVNHVGVKGGTKKEREYEQEKFRVRYRRVFGKHREYKWQFVDAKEWCASL